MLIYQGVVTAILAALLLNTLNNLRRIRRPLIRPAPASGPLVSILVPARNEARTIARCMVSLARQDYPHCEVLVLDDQSEDATAALVERVVRRHTRVRLLRGAALPPGWHGKAWACRQLAQAARGEWLLFVDADTVLARECVTAVLAAARERQADLLTLLPRLEAGGMGEALLLATMPLTFAGFLPQGLVMGRRWPLVAGALGKFLLFRRENVSTDRWARGGAHGYRGGHAARPAGEAARRAAAVDRRDGAGAVTAISRAGRGVERDRQELIRGHRLLAGGAGAGDSGRCRRAAGALRVRHRGGRQRAGGRGAALAAAGAGGATVGVVPAARVAFPAAAAPRRPARGDDSGDHPADVAIGLSGDDGGRSRMERADVPLWDRAARGQTHGEHSRAAGCATDDRGAAPAAGLALGPGRAAAGGDPHARGGHLRGHRIQRGARAHEVADAGGGHLLVRRRAGVSPDGWAAARWAGGSRADSGGGGRVRG